MMKPDWPRTRKPDRESNESQRYSYGDTNIDLFNRDQSAYSNEIGSLSSEESSNDYESSEDEDDFEESEREVSLDDWMSDAGSRDAPDMSLFRQDPGHKSENETAAKSSEDFLELLFGLSLSLSMEALVNG
ncbi:hypothetical protein FOXG_15495 [Fusarium oxysporum f. sp. lycopersici 4287]|uniref:Uncharacterized protein n=2 Tax=Fusarium oxysporum TaxID=5507 RepID=A0A0J9W4D0_FUSO4|nr:hypothetical protein FOXG_15495 [Fusarium oxysporum f. sp. lycopersici 4287]KNB17723.1 hypothetical protein FOXG_15495 [Fusarium oxysporum f. sp. lycopersici 4287]